MNAKAIEQPTGAEVEVTANEETLHLLRSQKNASRLLESIAQIKAGEIQVRCPDAEGTPPVLWKLCKNCFGTGTLFVGKGRLGVSRVCPVCKGKTKVPA